MMWVFGYGSLMWNPGFEPLERHTAVLHGWKRSFCMKSFHYRGTPDRPGLVLALDRGEGESCTGVAFAVSDEATETTLEYLRRRELISDAYFERRLPVLLMDGRSVEAICYVIDPAHVQYCAGLSAQEQARIIAAASGQSGTNVEYLCNTVSYLEELGIVDPFLSGLVARVRALNSA